MSLASARVYGDSLRRRNNNQSLNFWRRGLFGDRGNFFFLHIEPPPLSALNLSAIHLTLLDLCHVSPPPISSPPQSTTTRPPRHWHMSPLLNKSSQRPCDFSSQGYHGDWTIQAGTRSRRLQIPSIKDLDFSGPVRHGCLGASLAIRSIYSHFF